MRSEATISIGELAKRAGLSVSAIRFYERKGLMPEPERLRGQRRYGAAALGRLAAIAVAKQAGLTLAEIRALLDSVDAGAPAHEPLRAIAIRKLPELEATIEQMQARRGWLVAAQTCGCETLQDCALFAAPSAAR
jgi:MerR family redox-sensitive transcriptional activator SoxR